jgi:hypothetical protein
MVVTSFAVATLLVTAGAVAAQPYEQPTSLPVIATLPPELAKGPYHTVLDPVVADGYMLHYRLTTPFGRFETVGTGALRKLVHELHAIDELKKITGTEAFTKALGEQALKPVEFAKNVVTKPGETLTGVPKGMGRLFSNVSNAVTKTPDPAQESRSKELLLIGSFKREYAARFDADPYSSNPVLQEELDKLAKASAFGLWTASIGTMPIGGTAGAVLTATSMSQSFNNVLKTEPPSRVRAINEGKLGEMKIAPDLAKRFLDHAVYSPRHDLILVDSLHRVRGATGLDRYLAMALKAEDEVDANFFVNVAQTLRGYHEKVDRIAAVTMFDAIPVARSRGGVAIIPLALDHGVWTANADRVTKHLKATYKAPGFGGRFELWLTGTLSARAKQELQARGFAVVERVGSRLDIVD